jgi:hypothetical protein
VAARNLGELAALIAAGALMTEYVLTVAVDLRRGRGDHLGRRRPVPRRRSAGPRGDRDPADGQPARRAPGRRDLFAPTYAFVLAIFALIAVGLVDPSGLGFTPTPVVGLEPIEGVTVLLVLRAFSSGATAMTGIEALSNAVPAFSRLPRATRAPSSR